ncbi:MAG: AcrR family transcriptional regulator [bacterium]|jgi:AcrR family transcriptional regulator
MQAITYIRFEKRKTLLKNSSKFLLMTLRKNKTSDARERVLKAGVQLFAEKGFKTTTTRMIAKFAGVNEVTLFRLFGSKMELFQVILKQIQHVGFSAESFIPKEELSAKAAIHYVVSKMFELFETHPMEYRLLNYALLDKVEHFETTFLKENIIPIQNYLGDAFERLYKDSKPPADFSPKILSGLLLAQVFGISYQKVFLEYSPLKETDYNLLSEQIISVYLKE